MPPHTLAFPIRWTSHVVVCVPSHAGSFDDDVGRVGQIVGLSLIRDDLVHDASDIARSMIGCGDCCCSSPVVFSA
jgi:hypothetical protein